MNHVSPTTLGIKTLVLIYGMGDNSRGVYVSSLLGCLLSKWLILYFVLEEYGVVSQLIQQKLQIRGYLGMYQPWSVQRSHMTPQPWKLRRAKAILRNGVWYVFIYMYIYIIYIYLEKPNGKKNASEGLRRLQWIWGIFCFAEAFFVFWGVFVVILVFHCFSFFSALDCSGMGKWQRTFLWFQYLRTQSLG